MSHRRALFTAAALAALAALAACTPPDPNGPAATVEKAYAGYLQEPWTGDFMKAAPYTSSLAAAVERAEVYGRVLDQPVLDYNPIANAQDGALSNLKVRQVRSTGDTAVVRARFDNAGQHNEVFYDMKRQDGVWKIDNIRASEIDLRQSIEDSISPTGEPSQMRAPVQAIYDTYGPQSERGKPAAPLHRWAAVSTGFRGILETRAARAPADTLGFDPVVDGLEWKIENLRLEPASSAVIAYFDNAGANHVIVYDLVQEDSAWRIDNIRSPGKWDVRAKLSEAGAKSAESEP